MKLLVSMAVPMEDLGAVEQGSEGYVFKRARIDIIDWDEKKCVKSVEYTPPPENLGEECSVRFTGGCPHHGKWYQTSGTEVVIYNPQDWSVERVISHPSFHDLHGVTIVGEEIAVVNTGLDMVQFLNPSGEILREVNTASVPTWERFDRDTDYRRVISTKPHEIHPNHAFQIDGQWWVTRCLKRDAVNMSDPEDRIDIGVGQPHDGIVRDRYVYFTTTSAHLVIADIATRKVEEVIDLNQFNPKGTRIGWCRGLEVHDGSAYIGFTRVRRTKWAGAFQVAKDVIRGRKRNSHIEKIDLTRKELVDAFDYESRGSAALFTLMHYDRVTGALPNV